MRFWNVLLAASLAAGLAACSDSNNVQPSSPTATVSAPSTPAATVTGISAAVTGTWVGTARDSSGTTPGMCMGIPGGATGTMTWNITHSGPGTFAGTVAFSGMPGGRQMPVSGTIDGRIGTFTITMPNGTMPMMGWCGGQVTGTFDLDDMLTLMHGAYDGTTPCAGPFNNGQLTMNRR